MSEEAEMEIMALESIFGDEMEIIDPGRKIAVEVADPSDGVSMLVCFIFLVVVVDFSLSLSLFLSPLMHNETTHAHTANLPPPKKQCAWS